MNISPRSKSKTPRHRTPRARDSKQLKTSLIGNPQQQEEAIVSLGETQKIFERNGNFMQAQNTKKKGQDLKDEFYKKQLEALKKDHSQQNQQIYLTHELEMKKFQISRAKKYKQYTLELKEREEDMIRRHQEELKNYEEGLNKQHTTKLRQSPQLINYKKVLGMLVKQEKYFQAQQLKSKIDNLQKQQNPKFMYQRNKKIQNLLFQKREKQKAEMKAFKQKFKSLLDKIKHALDIEQNQLRQKYTNIMSDLELNQKLQLRTLQKQRKIHKDKYSATKAFTYLGN